MKKGKTIRGDRFHIGFFGKRNAGKSSLVNAITGQETAIVSGVPGTTTDPVYRGMELLPLGPVVLIDTAGLDDGDGDLGELRKARTGKVLGKTDLALVVADAAAPEFSFEEDLLARFEAAGVPAVVVLNKVDMGVSPESEAWGRERAHVAVSCRLGTGILELKEKILETAPPSWEPPFVADLLEPGETAVLVIPIDTGAPRGRLIMPQVKALRDILDAGAVPIMCRECELALTLDKLRDRPALVITDSQVFERVAELLPADVPLTSFSILSARQKGDLDQLVRGLAAVKNLAPGDRVLVTESCTHHPQEDDIGRIKIPRWLDEYAGGGLEFDIVPGGDFPEDLRPYKLVVHCGACTLNRREMLSRLQRAAGQDVPVTNYGVLIAFLKSVFPRALEPIPRARELWRQEFSLAG